MDMYLNELIRAATRLLDGSKVVEIRTGVSGTKQIAVVDKPHNQQRSNT